MSEPIYDRLLANLPEDSEPLPDIYIDGTPEFHDGKYRFAIRRLVDEELITLTEWHDTVVEAKAAALILRRRTKAFQEADES
jgi:hypothetical protein